MSEEKWNITTREGLQVTVRPADLEDEGLMIELFDHVSPQDLRFRFLSAIKHVSRKQIADLIDNPKKVLAIPGIGKGMLVNLQEMFKQGKLPLHAELLKKYHPSMLDLLKIQGLGPKTIALIWSAYKVSDPEGSPTR